MFAWVPDGHYLYPHYLDPFQQNEDLMAPQFSTIVFISATLAVTQIRNL